MSEFFAVIFGMISGSCLFIIALRSGMPLFGSIVSKEVKKKLDATDKTLAFVALCFFIICMILVVNTYS